MRPFCCLNEFVRHLFEFALVYFNIVEADGETYRAVELHYALNLAVVFLKLEQAEHAERNDFAMQVVMSVLGYSRAVVDAVGEGGVVRVAVNRAHHVRDDAGRYNNVERHLVERERRFLFSYGFQSLCAVFYQRVSAYQNGTLTEERIDESVRRILKVKEKLTAED